MRIAELANAGILSTSPCTGFSTGSDHPRDGSMHGNIFAEGPYLRADRSAGAPREMHLQSNTRVSLFRLTPSGWIESRTRPPDAVETWRRASNCFPNEKRQVQYTRSWADAGSASEDLKALRESFPAPEERVSGQIANVLWEIVD